MESKGDKALTGISRWACPWPAQVSDGHTNTSSLFERDQSGPHAGNRPAAEEDLPKDARRRLQTIGLAATSFAASVWLIGVIWVWQSVAG